MKLALIIIHVIVCIALVAVVLLQQGKQQGLSGAIAGGAETFFGKNKAKTMDGMLKKATAILAALFIICSIALALVAANEQKAKEKATQQQLEQMQTETQADVQTETETRALTINEKGELVDEAGSVIATAEGLEDENNFDENGDLVNAEGVVMATAAEIEVAKAAATPADGE